MDNHSQNSNSDLPNTPRVGDKILQYYRQFGQERDLKKFMRLYSPVSSQDSAKNIEPVFQCTCCKRTNSGETISSTTSCEALVMKPLNDCYVGSSKSLPNIVQGQPIGEEYIVSKDVILDINIEAEGEKEKIISISTEDLKTPIKTFKNTKTQTPESVAKTHRRLEWDSLGDIGYKKSMSASNISTIERSLLREFFKENSAMSEPSPSVSITESQKELGTVQKQKVIDVCHSTPPLACSTFVGKVESGAKPKMISQYTSSTSLYEKFEKYVQTSLMKAPTVRSQEIQCMMSSSNSGIESTASPSSFEYYSSKSSKPGSSKLSDNPLSINSQKQSQLLEHPYITSITDLLMKRKCLGEKNQQKHHHNRHEIQTKFQVVLNENKENQSNSPIDSSTESSFSFIKQAPELDLGIQLICSLIDAKSINGRQKKQLIRDIIKRITCLEPENKTANSSIFNTMGGTTDNSGDYHQHVCDSHINNRNKQEIMRGVSKLVGVPPLEAEHISKKENSLTANTHTSDNLCGMLIAKQTKNHINSKSLNFPKQHEDKNNCKHFPSKINLNENSLRENRTNVSSEAAAAIINDAQSEVITMREGEEKNKETGSKCTSKTVALDTKSLKTSIERRTNRCTQTLRTSPTSTSVTSTAGLTTQKCIASSNNELSNSNTGADQTTMREWLNPLTQSEIEYEEKKQIEMKKKAAAQQQKLMKKSKHDCGRMHQLNWIETEINRLECLKHLLLKDETTSKSSTSASSLDQSVHKSTTKDSIQTDKLYDTVYSDKSSVLSKSAEHLVQEVEIILEESHEDVINLKDNMKRTKDRKKETQIMYAKEDDSVKKTKTKSKPKFRIINENINVHEEELLNTRSTGMSTKERQQRGKIDTPSSNQSEESESLRALVQQRKREFMEAYKSKKQHHYEALKLQQKKDLNYLNIQRDPATATDSEHYSVPHTMPRKYPIPLKLSQKETKIKSYENAPAVDQQKTTNHKIINTSSTNSTSTNTSSSMFCMSSDVSVPMGSQNTSTTPTTTHQYDDVATAFKTAGVAIQTSESIMRPKPAYGPSKALPVTASTLTTTACIQVKPKGIAYIIEFDDKHFPISNPTSVTDINSNDVFRKPKAKSAKSITTELTNNFKPSSASESLLTLREHLEKKNPKFLQHSKERKAILNQLKLMRQERDRQLREIIDNTSFNSLDRRLKYLPPPPIQKTRILKTKEMKALTNKRFVNLNEVVAKQEREIEEKKRRSNRILRDVFNKRLQKRVRSGKLSLNHSKTVI